MRWFAKKKKKGWLFTRTMGDHKDEPDFTLILKKNYIFMNLKSSICLLLNITTKKDSTEILLCTI